MEGSKGVLEVDLAEERSSGFLTVHPVRADRSTTSRFPCAELDAGQVLAAVEAAIDGTALDGALVRVRLEQIARDVYHALDHDRVAELLEGCFHHQLVVRSGQWQMNRRCARTRCRHRRASA